MGDLNSPLVRDEKPVVEGGVGKKDEIQNGPTLCLHKKGSLTTFVY